jgi:hypothetical protein
MCKRLRQITMMLSRQDRSKLRDLGKNFEKKNPNTSTKSSKKEILKTSLLIVLKMFDVTSSNEDLRMKSLAKKRLGNSTRTALKLKNLKRAYSNWPT